MSIVGKVLNIILGVVQLLDPVSQTTNPGGIDFLSSQDHSNNGFESHTTRVNPAGLCLNSWALVLVSGVDFES